MELIDESGVKRCGTLQFEHGELPVSAVCIPLV